MKKLLIAAAVFFIAFQLNAQVGIGTNTPNASAQLDVVSSTKGMLVPRMTATERGDIVSPAEGLLVYQTSAPAGFYVYKSGAWVSILDNSTSYLPLTGGALTGALTGTTAVFNSIRTPILIGGTGTSSTITYKPTSGNGGANADHIFQVGNNGATEAMRIKGNGNVGIGASPDASAKLDVSSTTQGVLVPRMSKLQRDGISSPATGLLVYQTDAPEGFYVYKASTGWYPLLDGSSSTLNFRGFSATKSNNYSMPVGIVQYIFNAEEFDTDNWFDLATSRFQPTIAGYYQMNGNARMYQTSNTTERNLSIYKNGTVFKMGGAITNSPIVNLSVSCVVYMNGTTDYLDLRIYAGGSLASESNTQSTYFQGYFLGY